MASDQIQDTYVALERLTPSFSQYRAVAEVLQEINADPKFRTSRTMRETYGTIETPSLPVSEELDCVRQLRKHIKLFLNVVPAQLRAKAGHIPSEVASACVDHATRLEDALEADGFPKPGR